MDILRVLGQVDAAATTPTPLYTVPALTSTTTSSLIVCNQTGGALTFRINIRKGGEATVAKQYLFFNKSVAANDSYVAVLGMTLAESDIVEVYASSTGLSFNLFGVETS